jgi:hypothetical protein
MIARSGSKFLRPHQSDLPVLQRTLSALPIAYPGEETWTLLDESGSRRDHP